MQARPRGWKYKSMYDFWADHIAKYLFAESRCIINLASVEYSQCVSKYLTEDISFITCVFGELIDGRVKQKGTLAKMARGGDGKIYGRK